MSRSKIGGGWPAMFHLDGLYNAAGQQRAGLLFALLRGWSPARSLPPLVREIAAGPFNTNAILAGYVAGLLARRLASVDVPSVDVPSVDDPSTQVNVSAPLDWESQDRALAVRSRENLGPLFGALGDRLFFGALLPAASLLGIVSLMIFLASARAHPAIGSAGPLLVLWLPAFLSGIGFLVPSLYWRRRAWRVGVRGEEALAAELAGRHHERWARTFQGLARIFLGIAFGLALLGFWRGSLLRPGVVEEMIAREGGNLDAAFFVLLVGVGWWTARQGRIPPLALGAMAALASVLFGLIRSLVVPGP